MAKNELKVLGAWFSPFAMRVKIALNIKGLEYDNIEETFIPKSDLLLQSNPVYKKIPVFFHGDKIICESSIIVEYIDEVWSSGPSILAANALNRANDRFWVSYIDNKWFMSMKNILAAGADEEAKKPYFVQMEEVLVVMEDVLEKCSKGKEAFFGGDKIGLIDIVFGSLWCWLSVIEKMNGKKLLVEAKNPGLVKWAERFAADSSVKELIPETHNLIEFAKALQQQWAATAAK